MNKSKRSPLKELSKSTGSQLKKPCKYLQLNSKTKNDNKENTYPHNDVCVEGDNDDSRSSDGFAITDEFELDNPEQEVVQNSISDSTSPFLKSVITSQMLMFDPATSLKLSSGQEGCSPALKLAGDLDGLGFTTPNRCEDKHKTGSFKFRRCVSLMERSTSNSHSSSSHNLPITSILDFTSPVSRAAFKRPSFPDDEFRAKRMKSQSEAFTGANTLPAWTLSDTPNLTADRCASLALPTISGAAKNRDLNNIDCHVMAKLLNGDFADKVASFRVIDARYKYEFNGGHIRGAENFGLWDEKRFFDEFLPHHLGPKPLLPSTSNPSNDSKSDRSILIFHCEFSSARGPALLRALREKDRQINSETYPALYFPECYLLHDGYKTFYANYPTLCDPQSYIPMSHPGFISEERKFHQKSRTCNGGGGSTIVSRTGASSRFLNFNACPTLSMKEFLKK